MYFAMLHMYTTPMKTVRTEKKSIAAGALASSYPEAGKLRTTVVQHRIYRGR